MSDDEKLNGYCVVWTVGPASCGEATCCVAWWFLYIVFWSVSEPVHFKQYVLWHVTMIHDLFRYILQRHLAQWIAVLWQCRSCRWTKDTGCFLSRIVFRRHVYSFVDGHDNLLYYFRWWSRHGSLRTWQWRAWLFPIAAFCIALKSSYLPR